MITIDGQSRARARITTALDRRILHYASRRLAELDVARCHCQAELRRGKLASVALQMSKYLEIEYLAQGAIAVHTFADTGYACATDALTGLREKYRHLLTRGAFEPAPGASAEVRIIAASRRRAAARFVREADDLLDDARGAPGPGRKPGQ